MKKLFLAIALAMFSMSAFAAVDLNTANKEELMSVNGIGARRAEAIIEHRTSQGAFKTVDDLEKVKGFSKKIVDRLKAELTVAEGETTAGNKSAAKPTKKQ